MKGTINAAQIIDTTCSPGCWYVSLYDPAGLLISSAERQSQIICA